jgi:TRAP-type C4-dicarboxylate transport system substrate-binding protein
MLKNIFLFTLFVMLTAGLVFAGCTQTAPGPAPSGSGVIELSFAHHEPPVSASAKIYAEWAKKIEDQSQGSVKISMYPGQSLANLRDLWQSVTGGVADIGLAVLAESSKDLPLATVMKQSATGIPDGIPGLRIWEELWDTVPELRDEFKDVKMMFYFCTSASSLHTNNKEVRVPDDVKGMKVVVPPGGAEAEFMRLAGATPVALPAPEWFMALERGMAEAGMFPYAPMRIFGTMELHKYHVDPAFGPNMLFTVMNIDKWNSLPPDIQKLIEELGPPTNELLTNQKVDEVKEIRNQVKDMGHTIVELTPEEQNQWDAAVATASDKWIQETEALGKPASKIFEIAKELAKKYRK